MKKYFSWYRLKYTLKLAECRFVNIFVLIFDILCWGTFAWYKTATPLVFAIVILLFIVGIDIGIYLSTTDKHLQERTQYRTYKDPKHQDYGKLNDED